MPYSNPTPTQIRPLGCCKQLCCLLLCPLCVMAGRVLLCPSSCSSGWSPAWLGLGSCWSQCAVPEPEERPAVKHWPLKLGQMLTRTLFACPSLGSEGAACSWGWCGFYKPLKQGPLLGHPKVTFSEKAPKITLEVLGRYQRSWWGFFLVNGQIQEKC